MAAQTDVAGLYGSLRLPQGSKCIRVLNVHAPTTSDGDDGSIQADLCVVDLDQKPEFTALSYVWGLRSPEPKKVIIGNCTIYVTSNCHSALKHLRRKLLTFSIWIDALCINQADQQEKSDQIPLMRDIYSRAKATYIWLGEGDAATDRAMYLMANSGLPDCFFVKGNPDGAELPKPRVVSAFWSFYTSRWSRSQHIIPFFEHNKPRRWTGRFPFYQRVDEATPIRSAIYDDLDELLTREWPRRIWTFQEILFAANPIVVCGNLHVPWSRFSLSAVFLECISQLSFSTRLYLPGFAALSTWKKVVLSRDSLMALDVRDESASGNNQTNPPNGSRLLRYQSFVHRIAQLYNKFTTMLLGCFILCGALVTFGGILLVAGRANHSKNPLRFLPMVIVPAIFFLVYLLDFRNNVRAPIPFGSKHFQQEQLRADAVNDLVDVICTRKASNPKDMAFGVRSVLEKLLKFDLPAPDYSLSQERIYKDLTTHILQVTGSLQILIAASLSRLPTGPSWVPNWESEFPKVWFKQRRSISKVLNAAPASQVWWRNDPDHENILRIRGRQVCTISGLSQLQTTSETYEPRERAVHVKNLGIMLQLHRNYSSPFTHELDSFFSELLDLPTLPRNISAVKLNNYAFYLRCFRDKDPAYILSRIEPRGWMMRQVYRPALAFGSVYTLRDVLPTHIALCNALARIDQKIFRTRDLELLFLDSNRQNPHYLGGYGGIGICSRAAQVGDQVILISGLPIPVIVRRHVDSIQLISPAFCPRIMEGQAWVPWEHEGAEELLEEFRVC